MPRGVFVLKMQRELCHPKYARKVSGLSRNRPQVCCLPVAEKFALMLQTGTSSSRGHFVVSNKKFRFSSLAILVKSGRPFCSVKLMQLSGALPCRLLERRDPRPFLFRQQQLKEEPFGFFQLQSTTIILHLMNILSLKYTQKKELRK